jgi:hypothetical protein
MLGNPIEIHLMPQQVTLLQAQRRLPVDNAKIHACKIAPATEASQEWAIETCRDLLAQQNVNGNLHVTFSDLWTRYVLIRLGDAGLSDEDALSLARVQFSRHYPGAEAASWPLRLSMQGRQLLVTGIDPVLFNALKELALTAGKRLIRAEPLFGRIFDQYESELAKTDGWVLLDEPCLLLVAYIEHGQLFSIHSQRSEPHEREKSALLLLERQAALIARPAGEVRIFSYSGTPFTLSKPWHTSRFISVGHAATGSPASLR